MPTFVFNDETEVNSYGFSIPNKGISLKRFKGNPVMLDQHYNSTSHVVGRWEKVRIDGSQLLGDSDFDSEDPEAARIEGKVDRGFIKGASMGVTFNRDKMVQQPDGSWQLSQCELFEVSIVAVPSNRSSLTLFAETGEVLTDDQVKLSMAELITDNKPIEDKKIEEMEKFTLSAAALLAVGLQNAEDAVALSTAILKLKTDLDEEKAAHVISKNKLTEQADLQATTLVNEAVLSGKITESERAETLKDAKENYALTAKLLSKMPVKAKLSSTIDNSPVGEVKTKDDFAKLSQAEQIKFKAENLEAYKALFVK